jgi:putative two-component system response regulator
MDQESKILVVDDNPQNVVMLTKYLNIEGYDVVPAYNGEEALKKVKSDEPDLILLDIMMPGVNGYEVCKTLKEDDETKFIPVVMITALKELEDKIKAIEVGADDFLSKPFNRVELLTRVKSLLKVKHFHDDLDTSQNVIFTLALAVEAKDPYTRGHSERVARYASYVALDMNLPKSDQRILRYAGILHDIGKIAIPDSILRKQGKLSEDEYAQIKVHPVVGETICNPLKTARLLLPVIRGHHERFDGGGYPDGLKGDGIPLLARIMSVADAYDAMTSERPYRPRMPQSDALDRLRGGSAEQWDPDLVEVLVKMVTDGRLNEEQEFDAANEIPSFPSAVSLATAG